jgi:hypothetical protein
MADYSNVLALCGKALKSFNTGGFARATAYYAEAFEAARALDPAADCMIVACLQSWYAYAMLVHADRSRMAPSEKVPVLLKLVSILDAAAAALQSRRAAGSLKSVGLRPAESAFALTFSQLQYKHAGVEKPPSAIVAESAGLTIYTTYMKVAICIVQSQSEVVALLATSDVVGLAQQPDVVFNMRARYDFVASALDLIAEPRTEAPSLSSEAQLVEYVDKAAKAGLLPTPSMDAAWQRLQRSGVIQERDILSIGTESLKEVTAKVESVAAAKAVARGLRSCALAACAAREVHASQFKACGACKTVVYCSREHQLADWPAHKAACKAARKASAVSAAQSDA